MPKPNITERPEFLEKLEEMGYVPSKAGFKTCIKENLKSISMSELARRLNISKIGLRDWMNLFGLKNPNKPGGNNNPGGCYGKGDTRRNLKDGYINKKDGRGAK